ncbi:hypothetical protein MKW98_000667 [Papaver atlanticum]|uniref:Complex III subunit 9 n=1 Tax=Papaver atlanticum TaxID=357466 RepID=A0AAD4XQC1_9MAGN|nr:hypothetical protein MKW98_000667 [Papaver atlanticum]
MDNIFKKRAPKTGGFYESAYKLFMRKNSVYVTAIIIGVFAGERAVDYGVKPLWENNNKGKVRVLGRFPSFGFILTSWVI